MQVGEFYHEHLDEAKIDNFIENCKAGIINKGTGKCTDYVVISYWLSVLITKHLQKTLTKKILHDYLLSNAHDTQTDIGDLHVVAAGSWFFLQRRIGSRQKAGSG